MGLGIGDSLFAEYGSISRPYIRMNKRRKLVIVLFMGKSHKVLYNHSFVKVAFCFLSKGRELVDSRESERAFINRKTYVVFHYSRPLPEVGLITNRKPGVKADCPSNGITKSMKKETLACVVVAFSFLGRLPILYYNTKMDETQGKLAPSNLISVRRNKNVNSARIVVLVCAGFASGIYSKP